MRIGGAEAIVLALDAVADGDPTGLCRGLINVVALLCGWLEREGVTLGELGSERVAAFLGDRP